MTVNKALLTESYPLPRVDEVLSTLVTVNKALLTESYPLPRVDEVLSTLVTVNKALLTESYPLPRVDEVLSTLVTVNKALLTESYPLLRVDEVLSTFVTVNKALLTESYPLPRVDEVLSTLVTVNKALLTESYLLPRVDEVLSTLVTVNKALLTESYPLPRVDEVLSTLVTVNKALLTESYPLPRVDEVLSTLVTVNKALLTESYPLPRVDEVLSTLVTVNKALLTESYPLPRVDEVLSTLVTVNKALLTESYPLPRVDEVLSTLVTVNKALLTESYPLPRVDEVLSTLAGGKYFSKLDMSNAYLQLPLSDESKQYVVINTHSGLFQYNRLPFGVSSAPAIFQRSMETLLQGIKGVSVSIDDILISAATHKEHLQILEEVLKRLTEANLRLNRSKCFFLKPHLEHVGHIIDAQGRHPTEEKTRAIREAPRPTNVTELRSFLGIVNYYSKFLPNLSTHLSPLYTLLKRTTGELPKRKPFKGQKKHCRQIHFWFTTIQTSPWCWLVTRLNNYGIGAVLSQIVEDGQERPIMYTSRMLNPAEKNYSQVEKEALAIVSAETSV